MSQRRGFYILKQNDTKFDTPIPTGISQQYWLTSMELTERTSSDAHAAVTDAYPDAGGVVQCMEDLGFLDLEFGQGQRHTAKEFRE